MQFSTVNPANGALLASFDFLADSELEARLERSYVAARHWREWSLAQRLQVIRRVGEGLRAQREALAGLMSLEMGKLAHEALAEIDKCVTACDHYVAHAPAWLEDESVDVDGGKACIAWQPLGTVLAIMPWNFPFWQVIRCAVPALVGGNTMMLKHAPNVPQCAMAIEQLFLGAGAPKGVMQSVFVDVAQVERMIADPRIHAVTLTGSERAGRAVAAIAGRHLKKCVLELGGSDAFVVLDDADLDTAVKAAVTARFQNAGQSCIAAKRFIVVDEVHEAFVERFLAGIKALEPGRDLAPLARVDLRDALDAQVQVSVAAGARCLAGGTPARGPGAWYPATLLTQVVPGMPAADEELFGPVAAVIEVADETTALLAANRSRYGLGGSVWTRDRARGERFARGLASGMAFVNGMVKSDPRVPFGGVKGSGYGRELSYLGLREFLNAKTLWVQ